MDIEMSEVDRDIYSRLYVAFNDILESRFYAKYILKKRWHSESFLRKGSASMHQDAFTSSLIISYSRACKPQRKPKFPPGGIISFTSEERSLHDYIIRMRDKAIAHSDAEMHKVIPFSNEGFSSHIVHSPYPYFTKEQIELFMVMTDGIMLNIQELKEEILRRYVDSLTVEWLIRT